ncbi:TPA: hypothetical protein I7256_20520 [Vibrio vulnificus]|uniref:hypothetical protein n=1 Tax=Vibrio vulnificus TaxID=672 RepID=UPI000CD10983|nr:hypothetical protein [Vibrio vulnificus]POC05570.1 hypothetical protein CRN54_22815 [Vibrio vulnificus]HAS6409930.1 hypothetical protein [Vibrio vulnificus]HAS6414901.1 hypothetical protein [Vibrio vulnificus]
MYSRKTLREQNEKAFVEGADTGVPAQNPVGRPRLKGEKREPVTLSLTKTEVKDLDDIHKRLNFILYSKGEESSLDRSSFIRYVAQLCKELSDEDLLRWYKFNK